MRKFWRPHFSTLLACAGLTLVSACSIERKVESVDKNIEKMAIQIARLTDAVVKLQELADGSVKLIIENLLKKTPPAPTPDIDDILNPKPQPLPQILGLPKLPISIP